MGWAYRAMSLALALGAGCSSSSSGGDGETGTSTSTGGTAGTSDLARGVELLRVEANQGVAIPISNDAREWVALDDRNAPLIRDRATLVRAFFSLPADWTPRTIAAELTLIGEDGVEVVGREELVLDHEVPVPGDPEQTFTFTLSAEMARPGTQFQVVLLETEPSDEPEPASVPMAPSDGLAAVGFLDYPAVLHLEMVPIRYQAGTCDTDPVLVDAYADLLRYVLTEINPVQSTEVTIHAPVDWTGGELTDHTPVFQFLADLRVQDGAAPNVHYLGYIDYCDESAPDCEAAERITDHVESKASARVIFAHGLFAGDANRVTTLARCLANNMGRQSVNCAGTETEVDPNYPYGDGSIGVWGWGVEDFDFRPPETRSFMSDCLDRWVSDYGWAQIAPVIETLSSW